MRDSNIWRLENFGHRRPLGTLTIWTKRWLKSQLCCKCSLYFFFGGKGGGRFDHLRIKKLILFFYGTFDVILLESAILEFWRKQEMSSLNKYFPNQGGQPFGGNRKGPGCCTSGYRCPRPFRLSMCICQQSSPSHHQTKACSLRSSWSRNPCILGYEGKKLAVWNNFVTLLKPLW